MADLHEDIKRMTQIPSTYEPATFYPVKDPRRGQKDKIHKRGHRQKNIELIEESDTSGPTMVSGDFPFEYEITSSIRAANGGMDYSNQFLENEWKKNNLEKSLTSESLDTSSSSVSPDILSCKEDDNLTMECERDNKNNTTFRYKRNALIKGLIKNNIITLLELDINEEQNSSSSINNKEGTNGLANDNEFFNSNDPGLTESDTSVLVPNPEDEDFYCTPLQAFGTLDSNGVDFTVEYVGRKEVVTSRRYLINQVDDSFFEFKKKSRQSTNEPHTNHST
ncbi:uncharacterized protein LOC105696555 [Orussus abietinus]|uniref:uncharacterized protein LOC105696555 n=1 Tax=Orussus abietinus TaxID=222816 RepID=UPI0006253898|nr:uncharacterized protein LOC105696555 [Orussus abietinus]